MLPDVQVPSYDQAYGSLGSVYDPQVSQVNTEIAQLQPQQDAQQASLDQAKVNAFRDITTAANNKGMLFSGFTPDQQAQYVGTKYLPAVANLKTTFQNNKNSLLEKINAINADRALKAQGIVSTAQSTRADTAYKNAQLALKASTIRASSGGSGSSRTSSKSSGGSTKKSNGSSTSTKPLTSQQLSAAIRTGLNGVRGRDGYVAPQDYALAFKDWTMAGNSASTFDKYFGDLKNPKNGYYDYAKTQV